MFSFICLLILGLFCLFCQAVSLLFSLFFLFLFGFGFGLGRMFGSVLGVRLFALVQVGRRELGRLLIVIYMDFGGFEELSRSGSKHCLKPVNFSFHDALNFARHGNPLSE